MFNKEINFDTFVRGMLAAGGIAALYLVLKYLSPVLLPFFIAWIAAYLLYPIVKFLQYRCRLRNRILCIFLTLALVGAAVTAVAYIIVPPFVEEAGNVKDIAVRYIANQTKYKDSLPAGVQDFIDRNLNQAQIERLLQEKDVQSALRNIVPKAWDFL
ncbi:MAG: AI-2E family transporter [Alloprevotella sp.]|nr:AI-2E family transporter [Alloprevotella sp.]